MAPSSQSYHEPIAMLSETTLELHRALVSLQEELEAIDWYRQRADACKDPELEKVLMHNLAEEVEHAMMTLEWLRRREPLFDTMARRYLFSAGEISGGADGRGEQRRTDDLGVGDLKGDDR